MEFCNSPASLLIFVRSWLSAVKPCLPEWDGLLLLVEPFGLFEAFQFFELAKAVANLAPGYHQHEVAIGSSRDLVLEVLVVITGLNEGLVRLHFINWIIKEQSSK